MSRYIEARCPLRPTDKCSLCFPGANGPADCGLVWLSRDEREELLAAAEANRAADSARLAAS